MAGSVLTIAQALSVPFVTSKEAFLIETLQHTVYGKKFNSTEKRKYKHKRKK